MLSPVFFSIAVLGTLRRKRYGRILGLVLAALTSLAMFYVSWGSLFAVPKEMIKENYIFATIAAFIGLAFLEVIYFLSKPDTKKYFRQRSVNEE